MRKNDGTSEHNFANYLRELGYKVYNTHIENGQDFLTYNPDFNFDIAAAFLSSEKKG